MTRKKAGIYTRNGDRGMTFLSDKSRVSKSHYKIEAIGSIDELNAAIGLLCAQSPSSGDIKFYHSVQSDLFVIGAIISGTDDLEIDQDRISFIEEKIDSVSAELKPLANFILPGGSIEAAWLHMVRALCRKVERKLVSIQETDGSVNERILILINRLSDLFFVLSRKHNGKGENDILWKRESFLKGS